MGNHRIRSKTLPSSPVHSLSPSEFEFSVALSPRKSSAALCPADELFYKGQLLPLHRSPRNSLVRSLLLSSSTSTSTSRDSSSSTDSSASDLSFLAAGIDSSRPSSATDNDTPSQPSAAKPPSSRFSNLLRKHPRPAGSGPVGRLSSSAKEAIRKYLKKVKPLYAKLSRAPAMAAGANNEAPLPSDASNANQSKSFSYKLSSGNNLSRPIGIRRTYVASCPSSMRSSPSHSRMGSRSGTTSYGGCNNSTMEELQSAIQGAIAHCKNSMVHDSKGIV